MKCEGAKELFSEYLEGSIDHALTTAVRDHMDRCGSCKQDYESFSRTWGVLEGLPEIAPPPDFRHDIVMRAARMQHEKTAASRQRFLWLDLPGLLKRFEPARAVAVTLVVAALVLFGRPMYNVLLGHMGTAVPGGRQVLPSAPDVTYTPDLDSSSKTVWQSRKMGRNMVWVQVNPTKDPDGRMVYRLHLSINDKALLRGDACGRIGAEVILLPPNRFDAEAAQSGTLVWKGSILSGSGVLVPAIFDYSQGRVGSLNLLVNWRFRGREFSQIIYVPSNYRGLYSKNVQGFSIEDTDYMKSHTDLYSALQSIAQEYGVPVVANARIKGASPAVAVGEGDLEWMLRSTLQPTGLEWLAADNCVYVDKEYLARSID